MCKKLIAVTRLRMSLALLCIILFNQGAAVASNPSATKTPFVYRINVSGCTKEPKRRVQTGFRVKGLVGVVTALHGVVGCSKVIANADKDIIDGLVITRVDVANDIALLSSPALARRAVDGLNALTTTSSQMDAKDYVNVVVIGFPLGVVKARRTEGVRVLEKAILADLLPDKYVSAIADRDSPALSTVMLSLQAPLTPGNSGAPLINGDGNLVGVTEGGLDSGRVDIAWAVPWDAVRLQLISKTLAARLKELEKSDPQLAFSIAAEEEPAGAEGTQPPTSGSPSCDQQNPFMANLDQLAKLGCSDGGLVSFRYIVTQEFERGFMVVFDDPGNSKFTTPNQQRKFYALANDGRAWRVFFPNENVPQNTSPSQEDWYTCEKPSPMARPERSGIPWRGFGMVWCNNPDIRQALGNVRPGAGEVLGATSFQSYFEGRIFQKGDAAYGVFLNTDGNPGSATYLTGSWGRIGAVAETSQAGADVPAAPAAPAAPNPVGASACETPWFFRPHPPGCILQFRPISAEFQDFQRGKIVYLADVAKSFVLFDGSSWLTHDGPLASAAAAYAGQLGQPTGGPTPLQSCGGHTNDGSAVTAYVKDPFGGVTSWTMLIDGNNQRPGSWRHIRNLSAVAC